MSVQPLLKPAQADWSTDLAKLGPQIADEGRACDAENRYVGANIAALREHGFLGLAVPAELGGGGLSRIELADMLRELAHYCSATALVLAMHTHTVPGRALQSADRRPAAAAGRPDGARPADRRLILWERGPLVRSWSSSSGPPASSRHQEHEPAS